MTITQSNWWHLTYHFKNTPVKRGLYRDGSYKATLACVVESKHVVGLTKVTSKQ